MRAIFETFAPEGGHLRYQHSDSDMGHLMGLLDELGVNRVNLGPKIDVRDIRRMMPGAVIEGHMPPQLLRDGTEEEIAQRVASDFTKAGGDGALVVTTAGSISAGTSLDRIKFFMWCVDAFCRYDN
jgi:uroporphyrinogen decarboxylase